jgi:hypothetical protein
VAIDQQLDEVYRVRATPLRLHIELRAQSIRDLSNGSRSVGEVDDPLGDIRRLSTLIFEGMQKIIRAGDEEASIDALESRIGMSLNNRGPRLEVSLRGDHGGSGTIRDRMIQIG